ncbi:hypothetical protein WH47_02897 [Habropoda laboriosa]|uniref:Uncharacterized protein n=1 Tax=Habropoda laboriosa TaxID=597456 RepID=A0A0L7RHV3_9HYME|nr:hypothetical protein WH47_02897 [Habropoda laboriosa]
MFECCVDRVTASVYEVNSDWRVSRGRCDVESRVNPEGDSSLEPREKPELSLLEECLGGQKEEKEKEGQSANATASTTATATTTAAVHSPFESTVFISNLTIVAIFSEKKTSAGKCIEVVRSCSSGRKERQTKLK